MKATHRLQTELGAVVADIRLTRNTIRVHCYHPKAKEYNWGPSAADDVMMGRWIGPMRYILGSAIVDAWPESTHLVTV